MPGPGAAAATPIDSFTVSVADLPIATGALRARQLLAQPRVQVASVVKAGEKIGEAAAQQPRAVDRVLDAERRDEPEVRQEIARQLLRETQRIAAREHQHPVERLVTPQRDQRETAGA